MSQPGELYVAIACSEENHRPSVIQGSIDSGQANYAILARDLNNGKELVLRQAQSADRDPDIRKEAGMMERLQGASQDPPADWPLAWMDGKVYGEKKAEAASYWRYYNLGDLNRIIEACRRSGAAIPSAFGAEYLVTMLRAMEILLLGPGAPRIKHGDIIAGNVFLERAASDSTHPQPLGAIPKFVLGDFGESRYVTADEDWKEAVRTDGLQALKIITDMHRISILADVSDKERASWERIRADVRLLQSELNSPSDSPFPGPRLQGAQATFQAHRAAAPIAEDSLKGFLTLVANPPRSGKTYATRTAAIQAALDTNLRPPVLFSTARIGPNRSLDLGSIVDLSEEESD
ncbi:hypothetical protein RB595_010033 [Gaeumannomyces hyphopodioides]